MECCFFPVGKMSKNKYLRYCIPGGWYLFKIIYEGIRLKNIAAPQKMS